MKHLFVTLVRCGRAPIQRSIDHPGTNSALSSRSRSPGSWGVTPILSGSGTVCMVSETTHDEMTWYECDQCGLMFDAKEDARQHEQNCDAEEPSYIQ